VPPCHCVTVSLYAVGGRFDNAVATLRPLHYSREASRPEEGLFGCGAHTDYGMLTLLAMDGPGLQVGQHCTDSDSAKTAQ